MRHNAVAFLRMKSARDFVIEDGRKKPSGKYLLSIIDSKHAAVELVDGVNNFIAQFIDFNELGFYN